MKNILALISFSLVATACADTVKTREIDRNGAAASNVTAGEKGEKGDKGDVGDTGAAGTNGADGAQGIQGPAGPKGDKGEQGEKGEKGERGQNGIQGATGPKGDKGDKGDKGEQGDKGDAGSISKVRYGKLTYVTKEFASSSEIKIDFDDASLAQVNLSFLLLRDGKNAGASISIYVIDENGEKHLLRSIDVHSENNVRYQEYSHNFFLPKGSHFVVTIDNNEGIYVKYAQYSATLFN